MDFTSLAVLVVILLVVIFLLIYIWGKMLRKVGPNQGIGRAHV